MPYDAREIANYLLDRAESSALPLTHLALQKVLFFAHAWHLGKTGVPLIGQKFEAWQYGPVSRVVFDQLKNFDRKSINIRLKKLNIDTGVMEDATLNEDRELRVFLDSIYAYYGKFDASQLVDLTHQPGGPWDMVWKSGSRASVIGMQIPDESIKDWILRGGGREVVHRH